LKNPNNPEGGIGIAQVVHPQNQSPHLYFVRGEPLENGDGAGEFLYYDIGSKVKHALLWIQKKNTSCSLSNRMVTDEAWALRVTRFGSGFVEQGIGQDYGVIAGSLLEPKPKLSLSFKTIEEDPYISDFHSFQGGLLRNWTGGISLHPWEAPDPPIEAYSPALFGLPGYLLYARGNEALFKVNSGGKIGVVSWDVTHGIRQLLLSPKDITKGYGNFGTDGKDMVWTYGEGQPISAYKYPKYTLMTAPYTTDPEVLLQTQRKVRKDIRIVPPGYVVGCGYAAKVQVVEGELVSYTSLVRLSDGAEWKLKPKNSKYPMPPVGITCEELFVEPPSTLRAEIAALRIDSLGPPTPAPPLELTLLPEVHGRMGKKAIPLRRWGRPPSWRHDAGLKPGA
jgi:hypothetical protein